MDPAAVHNPLLAHEQKALPYWDADIYTNVFARDFLNYLAYLSSMDELAGLSDEDRKLALKWVEQKGGREVGRISAVKPAAGAACG